MKRPSLHADKIVENLKQYLSAKADAELFDLWRELVATEIEMEDDEDW